LNEEFWHKLQEGEVLLGVATAYPAPGIIEGMGRGWAWLWIDTQHGELAYHDTLHAVRIAASLGMAAIVRPDTQDYSLLGKCADIAPTGMMIPMVSTPQDARRTVEALRFPPLGNRSYGARRAIDLYGRDFYKELKLLVMAQIETELAARNAQSIIETDGIDALFFGPDDTKVRLGLPVNTPVGESKELLRNMEKTAEAARRAGKFCGCIAASQDALKMARDMGYQLAVGGGDAVFLRTGATARMEELRAVLDG